MQHGGTDLCLMHKVIRFGVCGFFFLPGSCSSRLSRCFGHLPLPPGAAGGQLAGVSTLGLRRAAGSCPASLCKWNRSTAPETAPWLVQPSTLLGGPRVAPSWGSAWAGIGRRGQVSQEHPPEPTARVNPASLPLSAASVTPLVSGGCRWPLARWLVGFFKPRKRSWKGNGVPNDLRFPLAAAVQQRPERSG